MNSTSVMADSMQAQAGTDQFRLVDRIASGNSEIYGVGVEFEDSIINDAGSATVYWSSDGVNHTHQYLAARGMVILRNDKGISYFNDSVARVVLEYCDKPDSDEVGLLFAGHFWNSETDKIVLGQKKETAKTRFLEHYNNAVQTYATNRNISYQYLGRALHYLEDIGEPHHASNKIAVLSNHSTYEKWADTNRARYMATTSNKYTVCTNYSLANVFKQLATFSKSYYPSVKSEKNFDSVSKATMTTTQTYVAGILYRYLKDVGEI